MMAALVPVVGEEVQHRFCLNEIGFASYEKLKEEHCDVIRSGR
jgi:hypothetical protein